MREMSYREKKQKLLLDISHREKSVKIREEKMLNDVADTHSRLRAYAKKLLKWERELMEKSSSVAVTHQVTDSDSDELSDDDGLSSSVVSSPSSSASAEKVIDFEALLSSDNIFQESFLSPSSVPSTCNRATPDIIKETSTNNDIYCSREQQSCKRKQFLHPSGISREISYESIPSHFRVERKRLFNEECAESLVVSLSNEEIAPSLPNKRHKI